MFFKKKKKWLVVYFTKSGPIERFFDEFTAKEIVYVFNKDSQENEQFVLIYKNLEARICAYTLEV